MATEKITLEEALDIVETRFIYNLPESELSHIERLFFQIEQAHWFYEDFLVEKYSNLSSFKLKTFAEKLFKHCPVLKPLEEKCNVLFDDFCTYRYQIPVCGCILLNNDMTKVVLVRNWKGTSWSFPKGKINQSETPLQCAIRETYEETGFNPSEYCNDDQFLVVHEEKKVTRLFVAVGIPENTIFSTLTRKEISKVEFHSLDDLPDKAWGVHPFLEKLQRWIRRYKERAISGISNDGKGKNSRKKNNLSSKFDERNEDTFGISTIGQNNDGNSNNEIGWTVQEMFATNSRLTGQTYLYDGNPHNFGSTHPQYVNYNNLSSSTTSTPNHNIKVNNLATSATSTTNSNINTPINNNNNNNNNRNNNTTNNNANQKQNNNNQQQQQKQGNDNSETILQNKTMKLFSKIKSDKNNHQTNVLSNKNYFNLPFSFNSNLVMQQVNKVLKENENKVEEL